MNILDLTLVKALERMQAGEFSAVEYVRAMLERSREAAHLNAIVSLDEQSVLESAALRDRQRRDNGSPELLGAPLLLKDNINTVEHAHFGLHTGAERSCTFCVDAPDNPDTG